MLQELKWPLLEEQRKYSCLTMIYQIMNHLLDICWHSYIIMAQASTCGHSLHFLQLHCSFKVYVNSFPHTICDWNVLEVDPLQSPSIDAFKV